MKPVNCHVFKYDAIGVVMLRLINGDTLKYIDLPSPVLSNFYSREFILNNASLISGEDNSFSGIGHVEYDYYFVFNIFPDGSVKPHTQWNGIEGKYAIGFNKERQLLYIDPETNEIKERFDFDYDNCYKKKTE